MKARILTAVLLMLALTTFAQTSRRGDQKSKTTARETQNNSNRNNNRTSQKQSTAPRESARPANNSRPAVNNQTVVTSQRRNTQENNNSRGNTNTGNSRRDNDNRNSANLHNGHNNVRGGHNNNYKGNSTHGGSTRVVVRDGKTYHREYVRIVRPTRKVIVVNNRPGYHHYPIEYRRVHYPYRVPVHSNIIWTVSLYNDFRIFYPEIRVWRYPVGYHLPVIPAYDAELYIGDVARVYGKVQDVYYDYDSDNYYLYIGDYYPYHDFSVVIPGNEARRFTRRPERYFEGSHIAVTGYITDFDNKPEIVVRRSSQIDLY